MTPSEMLEGDEERSRKRRRGGDGELADKRAVFDKPFADVIAC